MSYCGARTIEELQEKAEFVLTTANSVKENQAHGLK
jgi:IMP dehydrogenase/GMP reductase